MPFESPAQFIDAKQYIESKKSPKFKIIISLVLIIGLASTLYLIKNPKILKSRASEAITGQVISQLGSNAKIIGKVDLTTRNTHPDLFFVNLEYDPQTGIIKEISRGLVQADPVNLEPKLVSSDEIFSYRVKVVSDKNELLASGWSNLHKRVITTTNNKYRFNVSTDYINGATVTLFDKDNQIFWQGSIQ